MKLIKYVDEWMFYFRWLILNIGRYESDLHFRSKSLFNKGIKGLKYHIVSFGIFLIYKFSGYVFNSSTGSSEIKLILNHFESRFEFQGRELSQCRSICLATWTINVKIFKEQHCLDKDSKWGWIFPFNLKVLWATKIFKFSCFCFSIKSNFQQF